MSEFFVVGMVALVVAMASPLGVIPVLERASMVDVPNARSSHSHRALRGGGLAQCLGIAGALVTAILIMPSATSERLWPVLLTLLVTAGVGWAEDVRGLPILVRALAQALAGVSVVLACVVAWDEAWWWSAAGGAAVVGLVNVANFMDGVNGMSAAHGLVAGATFTLLGVLHDADWVILSGLALAAAFTAFIPWNYNGRLFLGDVGSYLLGGTSAIIIVLGWMEGLPFVALAAPFVIYVADTGVTLVGRVLARERWYEAHRDHTYQRLQRRGLSHLSVTAVVATASLACAALGVAASETRGSAHVIFLCAIALIAMVYTAIRFGLVSAEDGKEAT